MREGWRKEGREGKKGGRNLQTRSHPALKPLLELTPTSSGSDRKWWSSCPPKVSGPRRSDGRGLSLLGPPGGGRERPFSGTRESDRGDGTPSSNRGTLHSTRKEPDPLRFPAQWDAHRWPPCPRALVPSTPPPPRRPKPDAPDPGPTGRTNDAKKMLRTHNQGPFLAAPVASILGVSNPVGSRPGPGPPPVGSRPSSGHPAWNWATQAVGAWACNAQLPGRKQRAFAHP